jgi:acetyltransferase-like isoleucine patch superfamily enzyme
VHDIGILKPETVVSSTPVISLTPIVSPTPPDYYSVVLFDDDLRRYYDGVIFEGTNAIENPGYVKIGKNTRISHHSSLHAITNYYGKHSPSLLIGEGSVIGSYNAISACNKISIGNNVLIAPYVHINDSSHGYQDITKPIMHQPIFCKGPIVIEDDCWLGFGCHILSGVTVGKHSVIGANSVVTKNVPPFSVVAGSPAKILKRYDFKLKEWINV